MSTIFEPTQNIKLSQLKSICKKYDELELINTENRFSSLFSNYKSYELSELDDGGSPIKFDEKNYIIQSSFKKNIIFPYTEYKEDECNFIVVNCLKDHTTKDDYYVNFLRMVGSRPYHIVQIIQYETQIVINDEYTIDDFRKYEHFGTEDLETVGERLN